MLCALSLVVLTAAQDPEPATAKPRLGEQLFHDDRLSSSKGDMATSCASCHMRADPRGNRAFTEALSRSWRPWRRGDIGRDTLRNTPTILDLADVRYLHLDGEFLSLEELSRETLLGRNFGWLPEERQEAVEHLHSVLRTGGRAASYARLFTQAYGLEVASTDPEALVQVVATALSDYMRTLNSERDSPYDRFLAANAVEPGPRSGESARAYGLRTLEHLAQLRSERAVEYVEGFETDALNGYEAFLRSSGASGVGNCVACHVPPNFADGSFHNTGVAQEEYDAVHGEGRFADLEIPRRNQLTAVPERFRSIPSRRTPGYTDLGYWSFARAGSSSLRKPGEAPAAFFERMVARFKTPTLRHLAATDPYNHTGRFATLEQVLDQKMHASDLARSGRLRNADPELLNIRISRDDVEALVAFLNALNESSGRYRD